ncbi:MAG TPA: hypothetical protein VGD64_08255 [Acidisarcina sp.]
MKNLIRSLVLAPAVLFAAAAFAADTTTLNIPFSFTAHGKNYPAGMYSVSVDANRQVATLASKSALDQSIAGSLAPSDGNPSSPTRVRLEFSTNGSSHQLRKIRYGSLSTSDIAARSGRNSMDAISDSNKQAGGSGGQ